MRFSLPWGGGNLQEPTHRPDRDSEMIHFGWIRREWLALHESDAKYFIVCIFIVAPSMKLSFFEQCIEIFTSMGAGTCKNRPTDRTVIPKCSFLAGYVENGLLY